ncbi:hypothetical protein EMCRGX_G033553 [Ephydatia muelleri]
MEKDLAINVVDVEKSYGKLKVLRGVNMAVPSGTIYGLLGSSGCGKTTLLRCILGRLAIESGTITTIGKPPGTYGHPVPGRAVGYMPQESALYGDFTMMETMYYFGLLHGMSLKEIKIRGKFLLELLELPAGNKLIAKLSGGQQRRVSFAVALLQKPPLLILDEPTVGVDPLLRAKIWHHLTQLIQTQQTTIVITTHYIEEARQAHLVGLMRDGVLLAEQNPNELMQLHSKPTLEEVFLLLCTKRDDDSEPVELKNIQNYRSITGSVEDEETVPLIHKKPHASEKGCRNWKELCDMRSVRPLPINVIAQCWKNFVVLFCYAIGRPLSGISLAVCNQDHRPVSGPSVFCGTSYRLGDLLLYNLSNSTGSTLAITQFSNKEDAIDQVKQGKRLTDTASKNVPAASVIDNSTVHMYLDVTDIQVSIAVENATIAAYEMLLSTVLKFCDQYYDFDINTSSPLKPPVYGRTDLTFTDYMGPGVITSITFGISIGLTAVNLINERKEGLIDRTWVAGVNVTEIIIAQVVTQFFILLVQISLVVVVILYGFKIYNKNTNSLGLIGFLAMLEGLTGMAYGLVISAVCSHETTAIQFAIGSFYPAIVLSGVMWPLEGMPLALRYISYVLPTTYAAEAMRSIMGRGWGLSEMDVWRGYLVAFSWFVVLLILAAVGLRLRK